jgi:hypothetical protein
LRENPDEKVAFEKAVNLLHDLLESFYKIGDYEFKNSLDIDRSELGQLKNRVAVLAKENTDLDIQHRNLTEKNRMFKFLGHKHKVWYEMHKFTYIDLFVAFMGGLGLAGKASLNYGQSYK